MVVSTRSTLVFDWRACTRESTLLLENSASAAYSVCFTVDTHVVPLAGAVGHTQLFDDFKHGNGMVLQIHVDRIRDLKARGLLNRIHTTLSTVRAVVIAKEHSKIHDPSNTVLEHTQGMSVSIVIAFLCECGLLQGDEMDFATLQTQVLARPRHVRVSPDVARGLCIESVLRHVTCLAVCGDVHREAIQRTWAVPSSASTALGCVNWRSWHSLEKCMRLGEVIRLSFLLEHNMKTRNLLPDKCISEVIRDVVTQVHTVVVQMKCTGGRTMLMTDNQDKKMAMPSKLEPFTKMVSRIMVEVVVAGILRTDTQLHASEAYGLLRVNLLDLFGEQYMQWRSEKVRSRSHDDDASRIQAKRKLMVQTIQQHGRQVVYDQVQKMVTIVSGLMSVLPDMQHCTEQQHKRMQKRLAILCPHMIGELCESMQRQQTEDTGIHLLRNTAQYSMAQSGWQSPQPCMMATSLSTALQRNFAGGFQTDGENVSGMRELCGDYKKLPSNLYHVLQNFGPVFSADTPVGDPRHGVVHSFREYLAIAYLDIVHSLWASV